MIFNLIHVPETYRADSVPNMAFDNSTCCHIRDIGTERGFMYMCLHYTVSGQPIGSFTALATLFLHGEEEERAEEGDGYGDDDDDDDDDDVREEEKVDEEDEEGDEENGCKIHPDLFKLVYPSSYALFCILVYTDFGNWQHDI